MAANPQAEKSIRIIVNGKAAQDEELREAVKSFRALGYPIDVRVTWEQGDAQRIAAEAVNDSVDVVVAAGGDGTLNEVINGICTSENDVAVGVIPFGTANDFATSCQIPLRDPKAALRLVCEGTSTKIDVGKMNDRLFLNLASGGFGAEVTASTPAELKQLLGGAAYSLMGLVTALNMEPCTGRLISDKGELEGTLLVVAGGNGRQAGGGFQVTPKAQLNDGLLDLLAVHDVELSQLPNIMREWQEIGDRKNQHVFYKQLRRFRIQTDRTLQMNLDGEPCQGDNFLFEVLPDRLPFILPHSCPLLKVPPQST